ncbi:glutathione synthase [Streptomyces sp. CBMA123]|uniref:glutathione synthase n=1 Tax=Streptomyces sp. CBMA123 TaxID=1896313 RepID=UPI001661F5DF|nr:glutathione synthase [Streptomyces sp. CBMA123]MBD0692921.1 glutathione synthase [Streptomyces sp. CBMA123]
MIIVCGIASESPVARVTAELDALGLPYSVLHQRRFQELPFELEATGSGVRGRLRHNGGSIDLAAVTGVFARLMDWRRLPEVRDADEETQRRCGSWHSALSTWLELAPGCVMNRDRAMASNMSKPHQAQLIQRSGFRVPETLVTNDPDLVQEFRAEHGALVYKSISGVRSIVRLLDQPAVDRLPLIRYCPVQFQRYLTGTNVRVHTVAGEVFATRIDTDRVDYRYAHSDGGHAELSPWQPPDDLADRCLRLAGQLGLALAGIDLMLADDGEVYCFEVNPCPAYTYYEAHTGQPIARAIALALTRG